MASSVSILAQAYEASQVVSLNCLTKLIENKEIEITPQFSSPDDPNPAKFCLELSFGKRKEGYLSVYVQNHSKRRVLSEYQSLTLSSDVLWFGSDIVSFGFFESGDYGCCLGYIEFYKLSDLMDVKTSNQDWDIQIHYKIKYIGEFKRTTKMSKIEDTYPLRKLSDDLLTILINEKDFDITFVVDGKDVGAHRTILSARSDYFESMFRSGMMETNSDRVMIKDCDFNLFTIMIKFLYTDIPPDDIDGIAKELLPIADQFLVTNLKYHCEKSLVKSLNKENVKEFLLLALTHNCPELKNACFSKLTLSMINDWSELNLKSYPDLAVEYLQFLSKCHGSQ